MRRQQQQPQGRMPNVGQRRPGPQQGRGRAVRPPQGQAPQRGRAPQRKYNPFQTHLRDGERFGKIRKVLSGDTFVVSPISNTHEPQQEILVCLRHVQAPYVTRSKNDSRIDEPFGYEVREHVREMVLGTFVKFKTKPTAGSENLKPGQKPRELGRIYCNSRGPQSPPGPDAHWVDLTLVLLEHGCLQIQQHMFRNVPQGSENESRMLRKQELDKAIAIAQEKGLLIHGPRPSEANQAESKAWFLKHVRQTDWQPNHKMIFNRFSRKPDGTETRLNALVDNVRDGSTLRLEITDPDSTSLKCFMLYVHITGVRCEPIPKPLDTQKMEWQNRGRQGEFKQAVASKVAQDALRFTSHRLMNQRVQITFDAIDDTRANNLYATIHFPKGDIAQLLLCHGFAQVVPWTASIAGKHRAYSKLQSEAIGRNLNIWADEARKQKRLQKQKPDFHRVTKVRSGDSVFIKKIGENGLCEPGEGERVFLASIKAPKMGNVSKGIPGESFSFESQEFLRSRLIGKRVLITKEYSRSMKTQKGPTKSWFVTLQYQEPEIAHDGQKRYTKCNISKELIKAGLADLVTHGKNDDIVHYFGELQELLKQAKAKKIGRWNEQAEITYEPPYFENLYPSRDDGAKLYNRCKTFAEDVLGVKFRSKVGRRFRGRDQQQEEEVVAPTARVRGVVEYMISPTRYKVRLLEHDKIIALNLTAVKCPQRPWQGNPNRQVTAAWKSEIGQKAYDEYNDILNQRTIFVQVEVVDNYSNFIGHLITEDNRNIAVELLEKGYAEIKSTFSLERSFHREKMEAAEKHAIDNRLGVQKDKLDEIQNAKDEEEKRMEEKEEATTQEQKDQPDEKDNKRENRRERKPPASSKQGKTVKAFVTHIDSGCEFFAVENNDQKKQIDDYMAAVNPGTADPIVDIKVNLICACLFDGSYFRVKVVSIKSKADPIEYKVRFIDFGNSQYVPAEYLLAIEDEKIKNARGLAVKCRLVGMKPPLEKMTSYFQEAGWQLQNLCNMSSNAAVSLKIVRLQAAQRREIRVKDESSPQPRETRGRERKGGRKPRERYNTIMKLVDPDTWHVLASNNDDEGSINLALMEKGLARFVEDKEMAEKAPEYYAELTKLSNIATSQHVGMFQFGKIDDEDEEDDKRGRRRRPRQTKV